MPTVVSGFNTKWFRTLKRCDGCKRYDVMLTDGQGKFLCQSCGYTIGKVELNRNWSYEVIVESPGYHV